MNKIPQLTFIYILHVVLILFTSIVSATAEEYVPVNQVTLNVKQKIPGEWLATIYNLKEIGDNFFETSQLPAKICFSQKSNAAATSCNEAKGENNFSFQEAIDLKLVLIDKSETRYGILFTALHHGATIGKTKYISIWIFDANTNNFINALTNLAITDQGEFSIFPSLNESHGYFILADRIWDSKSEPLYAPHHYQVSIYRLQGCKYELVSKYKTNKKYKSLDDVAQINVIGPERQNIVKSIKQLGN